MNKPIEASQGNRQLNLFGCDHKIEEWCCHTQETWSPYFAQICSKCNTVFNYPDKDFLATWPKKSQERLERLVGPNTKTGENKCQTSQ